MKYCCFFFLLLICLPVSAQHEILEGKFINGEDVKLLEDVELIREQLLRGPSYARVTDNWLLPCGLAVSPSHLALTTRTVFDSHQASNFSVLDFHIE